MARFLYLDYPLLYWFARFFPKCLSLSSPSQQVREWLVGILVFIFVWLCWYGHLFFLPFWIVGYCTTEGWLHLRNWGRDHHWNSVWSHPLMLVALTGWDKGAYLGCCFFFSAMGSGYSTDCFWWGGGGWCLNNRWVIGVTISCLLFENTC